MQPPLVSILIPAFNHENYVEQTLRSVVAQTYDRLELIIVDDGSTDSTPRRIRGLLPQVTSRFERVVYVERENGGICRTLNYGVELMRGEYLKLMASDDGAAPDCVSTLVEFLQSNPHFGAVYSDGYHVPDSHLNQHQPDLTGAVRFSTGVNVAGNDITALAPKEMFHFSILGSLFSRTCLKRTGAFDEDLPAEDLDYILRVSRSHRIGWIPTPLVYHRVHESNTGWNQARYIPYLEALIAKLETHPLTPESDNAVALLTLRKWAPCFQRVMTRTEGKRIVAWGCGSLFRRAMSRYHFRLAYIVDSNRSLHGTDVDGTAVLPPSALKSERPGEVFVVVLTQQYSAAYETLSSWGFQHECDYF